MTEAVLPTAGSLVPQLDRALSTLFSSDDPRRTIGIRLVIRVSIGLFLVVGAWIAPGVPSDDAQGLAFGVALVWAPAGSVLDAVLRRNHTSRSLAVAAVVDLAVFLPAIILLPTMGAVLAVSQVPVVVLHGYMGPRPVGEVAAVSAVVVAATAELVTAATVVGWFGFSALTVGVALALAFRHVSSAERASITGHLVHQYGKAEALVTGVAEAVVVTSPRGRIREWNVAATRTFDRPPQETIGRSCEEILGLHKDVAVIDCSAGCAALNAKLDGCSDLELWREDRAGERQPLLVNASPVLGPDGNLREVVHSFRDIKGLRLADEAKTLFLATASHELKTPLAVIQGFTELLLDNPDDEEIRRDGLDAIHRRARDLSAIVDRLLMSSSIEAGKVTLRPAPGDVWPVLTERVRAFATGSARVIRVRKDADPPPVLMTTEAFATVVDQLLENAAKYSDPDTDIEVGVSTTEASVAVHVRDEGIGMSTAQLERCFDKFWQGEAADTRRYGGTGIGLYIVRAMVEALGGKISASSELGAGSTFTFSLPRADVEAPRDREPDEIDEGERSIIKEFMRQVGVLAAGEGGAT